MYVFMRYNVVFHLKVFFVHLFQLHGKPIKWQHLVKLVEVDMGLEPTTNSVGGVRMLPKLTYDHLCLNPSSRMRVKLAAQVRKYTCFHLNTRPNSVLVLEILML